MIKKNNLSAEEAECLDAGNGVCPLPSGSASLRTTGSASVAVTVIVNGMMKSRSGAT